LAIGVFRFQNEFRHGVSPREEAGQPVAKTNGRPPRSCRHEGTAPEEGCKKCAPSLSSAFFDAEFFL
jgi:hypothetical protein